MVRKYEGEKPHSFKFNPEESVDPSSTLRNAKQQT